MEHSDFKKGLFLGMVAGAVGALVLYKKRRRIMGKLWKLKVKADIHRRLGELTQMTRESYDSIVDSVLMKYRTAGTIAQYELDELGRDLKSRYESVRRDFEQAADELDAEEASREA